MNYRKCVAFSFLDGNQLTNKQNTFINRNVHLQLKALYKFHLLKRIRIIHFQFFSACNFEIQTSIVIFFPCQTMIRRVSPKFLNNFVSKLIPRFVHQNNLTMIFFFDHHIQMKSSHLSAFCITIMMYILKEKTVLHHF